MIIPAYCTSAAIPNENKGSSAIWLYNFVRRFSSPGIQLEPLQMNRKLEFIRTGQIHYIQHRLRSCLCTYSVAVTIAKMDLIIWHIHCQWIISWTNVPLYRLGNSLQGHYVALNRILPPYLLRMKPNYNQKNMELIVRSHTSLYSPFSVLFYSSIEYQGFIFQNVTHI